MAISEATLDVVVVYKAGFKSQQELPLQLVSVKSKTR